MESLWDIFAAIFLIAGAVFSLAAGVGLLRFPDLLSRLHAGTKPQILGLLLVLAAIGCRIRSWEVVGILVAIAVFQLLTAPVAAHMVSRAAYRTGQLRKEILIKDELAAEYARQAAELAAKSHHADVADSDGKATSHPEAKPPKSKTD